MRNTLRWKWLWLSIWAVLVTLILLTMPSMDQLIREKGQARVNGNFSSSTASRLLTEFHKSDGGSKTIDAILVFHKASGFTTVDKQRIKQKLTQLKNNKNLHMQSMLHPFAGKDAEQRLVSTDGKTLMAIASIEKKQQVSQIRSNVNQAMQLDGIETYLTGETFIGEDYAQSSIDGVQKTELFTVIFIIIVLIIVFRSPIAPVLSLLIVGITYLVSLGVVGILVEQFSFPFANTTQIFLVLVLFGIGTDYNILLFMRFKEELGQQKPLVTAIVDTYRTAGKTVLFSGLAVLIGFSMLGFSNFSIYQSAVAVAIGVVFLLTALFTLGPTIMYLFAHMLFWPTKSFTGHGQNRLWSKLSHFSVRRIFVSVLLVVVLVVPVTLFYHQQLSFDSLKEIDANTASVKGFIIVSKSFGAGQTLPTTLVIKADKPLDTAEGLAFLDELHERLTQIKGVKAVYGPTRPNGEYINDLYVSKQTEGVSTGIGKSNDGLDKISQGLATSSTKIKTSTVGNLSNINKLIDGTLTVRSGLGQVQSALSQINTGIKRGADGASQIEDGLAKLTVGLKRVNSSTNQLLSGYQQVHSSLGKLQSGYQGFVTGIDQLAALSRAMQTAINAIGLKNPLLLTDPDYLALQKANNKMVTALPQSKQSLTQLNSALARVNNGVGQANQGLAKLADAQNDMAVGAKKLQMGAKQLQQGLDKGAAGQTQVVSNLPAMSNGLSLLANGQRQLLNGLTKFSPQMKQLQQGLSKSALGLNQINNGLGQANKYLTEVTGEVPTHGTFFVPKNVREGKRFQQVLDLYMSPNRKLVSWTIPLSVDPYSPQAMNIADEIDQTIRETVSHTAYHNINIGVGGVSSMNHDLNSISDRDFSLTILLMLVGIGILLLILFRSVWIVLTMLGTLVLSYYCALTITENICSAFFGISGLSWSIPFFTFIMIIALGVDYSIFVMMRYREYIQQGMTTAIVKALERTGSVVISAAIILAGTFAAMYPSGVTTLVQIATVVIIGLLLLAFVLLPLVLPASIALLERITKHDRADVTVEKQKS